MPDACCIYNNAPFDSMIPFQPPTQLFRLTLTPVDTGSIVGNDGKNQGS